MINYMTTEMMKSFITRVALLALLAQPAFALKGEKGETLYYRYHNAQGVKVLSHSLPPEFAQNGYQLVTASGDVIKDVPPALNKDDAEKAEVARIEAETLAKWDKELRRRYSSVEDIEAARERKMAEVDGNIAILRSNVRSLRTQITNLHTRAANIERMGREVPASIVKNVEALEKEVGMTEAQIGQRKELSQEIVDKYQRDIERFRVIEPSR